MRRIQQLLLHIQGASNRNDSGAWNRSLQLLKSLQAMHFSAHMHDIKKMLLDMLTLAVKFSRHRLQNSDLDIHSLYKIGLMSTEVLKNHAPVIFGLSRGLLLFLNSVLDFLSGSRFWTPVFAWGALSRFTN